MYANYHTHTKRCGHAEGEDKEYIEAAIKAGIKELGFSDHCPWVFKENYISEIRMLTSQVDDYFDSLTSLRDEYKNDIKIYIGFEAEYDHSLIEMQDEFLADYPLDYMLLGQHFLGTETDHIYTGAAWEDEAVLKRYVDTTLEGMASGRYLYMAHPDVIHFTGPDDIYEKHMSRLCKWLKEHNIPVEINMLGAFQGRHYPSDKFLRIVKAVGNDVIIGIDAHAPEQITNDYGYEVCEKIIEKYGFPVVEKLAI